MSNILKWSFKNALVAMAAFFCIVVVICAFVAPVFAHLGIYQVSDVIYMFLHKLCKMHGTNIFTILGHPIGICARCIGGYIAAALTLHFYLSKFKMHKVVFIILGTLAIGEMIAEYYHMFVANDFIRLIAGFCFGGFCGTLFIKILDWLEGKKGW